MAASCGVSHAQMRLYKTPQKQAYSSHHLHFCLPAQKEQNFARGNRLHSLSLLMKTVQLFSIFNPAWNHLLISRQLQTCISHICRAALQLPLLHDPICWKQLVGLICDLLTSCTWHTELWRREAAGEGVPLSVASSWKARSSAAARYWVASACTWLACSGSLNAAAKAKGPENLFCCMMCHNWQQGIWSSSRIPIFKDVFLLCELNKPVLQSATGPTLPNPG